MHKSGLELEWGLGMSQVPRPALTVTTDITPTRARLTVITGLAGLTAASLSELARGMAGADAATGGADAVMAGAVADTTAVAVMDTVDAER
jgi:hypothetical protein